MTAVVLRGDARELPLEDASIDCLVTSPPYFALRSYTDNGVHYEGQIGSEATPREYIRTLLDCTSEWLRVVKPEGSIFVNLGDKYSQYEGARKGHGRSIANPNRVSRGEPLVMPVSAPDQWGIASKSLMGLPWRYALGCMDELGLILRSEIIWSKMNGLPESVSDRVRRSHEQVFHFTKQQKYYSAVDEIREAHSTGTHTGRLRTVGSESGNGVRHRTFAGDTDTYNALGKLPGSVWPIPTMPLQVPEHLGVDHFAAYPAELVKRIILGWSPREVCAACEVGRRPAVIRERTYDGEVIGRGVGSIFAEEKHDARNKGVGNWHFGSRTEIVGYYCRCTPYTDHPGSGERYGGIVHSGGAQGPNKGQVGYHIGDHANGGPAERTGPWREYHFDGWTPPPSRPGIVLDPFGGTGTTALTASVLGRTGITVDKSADYCRLAQWRTADPGERARVLGLPKPKPVPEGQMSLFDL